MTRRPKVFELHESGALLHGTKADLAVGDLLLPGRPSNFGGGRIANHVYVTATLDAATWGAELALGAGRGRIYIVEPLGALEDDPNVTTRGFGQPDAVLPHSRARQGRRGDHGLGGPLARAATGNACGPR